jgi:hypothetical protein
MELTDKILIVTTPAEGSTTDGGNKTAITLEDFLASDAFEDAVNALIAAAA